MRWTRLLISAVSVLNRGGLTRFVYGATVGAALVFGLSVALGTIGFSTPVMIGLVGASALMLDLSFRRSAAGAVNERWLFRACLVGWLFVAPALADAGLTVLSGLTLSTPGAVLAGLIVGACCVGLPCFLGTGGVPEAPLRPGPMAAGFASALVLLPLLPAGTTGLVPVAAGLLIASVLLEQAERWHSENAEKAIEQQPRTRARRPGESEPATGLRAAWFMLLIAGAGVAVISRIVNQTMPAGFQGLLCGLAAVSTGMVVGAVRWRNDWLSRLTIPVVAAGLGLLAVVAALGLFPEVVLMQLRVNAGIQSPRLLLLMRGLYVAALLSPMGLLLGSAFRRTRRTDNSRLSFPLLFATVGLVGCTLSMSLGTPRWGIIVAALLAVAIVATVRGGEGTWWPNGWFPQVGLVAVLMLAVSAPFVANRFRTDRAAQLLFSSVVFQEFAQGTQTDLLLSATDGRLLGVEETPAGITSSWRLSGARVQVRRNGIPVSVSSADPQSCPQTVLSTLPVVLPLLMHEAPQQVLLLGDAGPAGEAVSLVFPVQSVTAIDQNLRTDSEVDEYFAARHADDRFREISADPALAIAGLAEKFDIILSRPPQAALLQSAPYHTTEFFRRAANRLAPGGLFCQTFRQIDFGSDPIRCVLQSLRDVFSVVSAVQLERGEILLLATNGEQIIAPGFAERAGRAHVRRILDDFGWDWSKPLQLASLDPEAVDAILSTWQRDNTVANAAFLRGLPIETMRWGDKRIEIRQDIAAFQRRILDQLEESGFRDEAARRIQELGVEAEVLFGFPDVPWVYRKTLRTRLEQTPRPPREVVVKGQVKRRIHQTDEYRVEYLKTLANALQSAKTDPAALANLERFTTPTEPLVSYFASHEAARIHSVLGVSPEAELRHRLRTIYFAPSGTRSVRDVVAAVNLLTDHPEVIPDPARRWDQMNSLLQVLMLRWSARSNIPPSSSNVVLNDIEKCLVAIDRGITALEDWRVDAGIDSQVSAMRATYLRRRLERPLCRYRDELMPHHYKAANESMAVDNDVTDTFRTLGN